MQSDCIDHGKKGGPQGYAFAWDAAQGKKVLQHRLVFYRNTGVLPARGHALMRQPEVR